MEELIYDIMAKHFTGETSVKEDEYLNAWLSDAANKEVYNNLKNDWVKNMSATEFNTEVAWSRVRGKIEEEKKSNTQKQLVTVISVAAVLLVGLFVFLSQSTTHHPATHYASRTESKEVTLPDGTVVNLNKNSSLIMDEHFGEAKRTVSLNGEAFFDVQKNPDKPFVIHVNNTQVTVLGTSFNIKSTNSNDFELAVRSGVVSVSNESETTALIIEKGQGAVLTNGKLVKTEAFNKNDISWHTKMLFFEFTPLQEAVDVINSAYNSHIKLVVDHADCVINSKFDNEDLDDIVESICRAFNLRKETKQDSIFLYGMGCN